MYIYVYIYIYMYIYVYICIYMYIYIYICVLFWGALGGSGYKYGISISIQISFPRRKLSDRQHRSKAQESRSILILKRKKTWPLNGCVWKCCVPHCTQWFCWSLSPLNGYFIGNIPNIFRQTQINPGTTTTWGDQDGPWIWDDLRWFACF